MLDYRGYGGSQGSPTEDGIKRDALASERWLRERLARDRSASRVVYFGESLGCSVAVWLATQVRFFFGVGFVYFQQHFL